MIRTYLTAFQIGIIAGMRSMMAPALVSHNVSNIKPGPLSDSPLAFMTSPKTATTLAVLAGGELIGDKLPSAPDRTGWPQISGRLASGALSGAALTQADGQSLAYGGLAGALGAAVGSFAFFQLRHWLTHEKELPDPLVALAEDALALGAGLLILHQTDVVPTAA
ncbi:hypothetical protein GCM10028818_12510 [Spirosoma horti]